MNIDTTEPTKRATMNGKPVYTVTAKGVINFQSGFGKKLLCDSLTFSTGTACAYTCSFCYVPAQMRKSPHLKGITELHENIVIRREGAIAALRSQLLTGKGKARRFLPGDERVIYSSPLVDVAANMDLVRETADACRTILELTGWHIRLLSKSNLLPKVAELLDSDEARRRMIFGVSTGTINDRLAKAFEEGTPFVSKRIASIRALQDAGWRTFGMICPSLPSQDYKTFAEESAEAIRADLCEHVWAEVINVRGESMTRTVTALREAGFEWEAGELARVSSDKEAWEQYARETFEAHTRVISGKKLRFLQYVTNANKEYWLPRQKVGAVIL